MGKRLEPTFTQWGFGFKEPSGSKGGNWKAVKMQRWAVTGHTQGYASIHKGIQGYTSICKNIQGYTSIYKRAVT